MWKSKLAPLKIKPAGSSEMTSEDYQKILDHIRDCSSCSNSHAEFVASLGQLQEAEVARTRTDIEHHLQSGGLKARFLERAQAVGIRFSEGLAGNPAPQARASLSLREAFVCGVLVLVLTGLGAHLFRIAAPRPSTPEAEPVAQRPAVIPTRHDDGKLTKELRELEAVVDASRKQISNLKDQNAKLLQQISTLGRDLNAGRSENQHLEQSIAELRTESSQQASQKETDALRLSRTESDLDDTRNHARALEAENETNKAKVDSLSQQLREGSASLEHDRELLSAGRDITDLMGARNLHIIDVRDSDGKGKNKNSFGRIFYTEGKSLIFYAYDLNPEKGSDANSAFEVWGERLGEPTSIRNLGILYTDDKVQKRWALKVDDPRQLAEIDSVFVTLESHHGESRPLGGKILYAFLGGKANHP
jgi:uncharacterized protein YoxC